MPEELQPELALAATSYDAEAATLVMLEALCQEGAKQGKFTAPLAQEAAKYLGAALDAERKATEYLGAALKGVP